MASKAHGVCLCLVRCHDYRRHALARCLALTDELAQDVCHGFIGADQACLCIHHEHQHVRLGNGDLSLGADLAHEIRRGLRQRRALTVAQRLERLDPACVHQGERHAVPLARRVDAVARGAGAVVHNGKALTDQAVEQRALADVRSPDERHEWLAHATLSNEVGTLAAHCTSACAARTLRMIFAKLP